MKKILFQSDSVTDAWRDRENPADVGNGYVNLITSELGYTMPQQFIIENRGVAGDRSVDMLARWNNDCLTLVPDYLSILIGVNDVWHEIACHNGIFSDRYEVFLRMMLDDSTDRAWEYFCSEIEKRIETVRKLSSEYSVRCVHLQDEFNNAIKSASAEN